MRHHFADTNTVYIRDRWHRFVTTNARPTPRVLVVLLLLVVVVK